MRSNKFTEAPPRCQLHAHCQGFCESQREVKEELCKKCLEIRDIRFSGAQGKPIHFGYTNYRGEFSQRRATPIRFEFGSTEHHPEKQWLMYAMDHDKGLRAFALADMVFGFRNPIEGAAAARIAELEASIVSLMSTGVGKVKEENDQIRLQAGGMQMELVELREKLVIAGAKAKELARSSGASERERLVGEEIAKLCQLDDQSIHS